MQAVLVEALYYSGGGVCRAPSFDHHRRTNSHQSLLCGPNALLGLVCDDDFRKGNLAVCGGPERDERTAINSFSRHPDHGSGSATKQVDVSRSACALDPLLANSARDFDVLSKPLVLLFGPDANVI
jgi:hypothetical protein